jgi:hypothetical protein
MLDACAALLRATVTKYTLEHEFVCASWIEPSKIGDVWKIHNDLDFDGGEWDAEDDHTDVPISALVKEVLGISTPELANVEGSVCVAPDAVNHAEDSFTAAARDSKEIYKAEDVKEDWEFKSEEEN